MPKTVAVGAASPMSVRLAFGRMLMMYDIGNRTKNDCANPCAMTNADRPCPLKYPMKLKSMLVTIASGAKPFKYSAALIITARSSVKSDAKNSPWKNAAYAINTPIAEPISIPHFIAPFALSSLPAPTFCATNDAIDCIIDDGISITKDCIFWATP